MRLLQIRGRAVRVQDSARGEGYRPETECCPFRSDVKPSFFHQARQGRLHCIACNRPPLPKQSPHLCDTELALFPEQIHDLELRRSKLCFLLPRHVSSHKESPTRVGNPTHSCRCCQAGSSMAPRFRLRIQDEGERGNPEVGDRVI